MFNLGHAGAHVNLALDLLTGPAGSLDGALTVLASCPGLANQGGDPITTEVLGKLAVGEGISEITGRRLALYNILQGSFRTYPMTPMEERIKPSLRLPSWEMIWSSWKMDSMKGWIWVTVS